MYFAEGDTKEFLGDIGGRAGWSSEQPDRAIGVLVHCRELSSSNSNSPMIL